MFGRGWALVWISYFVGNPFAQRACIHLGIIESKAVLVSVSVGLAESNESIGAAGMSGATLLTSLAARRISPCLSVSLAWWHTLTFCAHTFADTHTLKPVLSNQISTEVKSIQHCPIISIESQKASTSLERIFLFLPPTQTKVPFKTVSHVIISTSLLQPDQISIFCTSLEFHHAFYVMGFLSYNHHSKAFSFGCALLSDKAVVS